MNAKGFTLVEVITVVVILAIVSTVGSRFMISTLEAYNQTQTRSKLINTSRQALERMVRQLRAALPYSLRETNTDQCMQFLPIAGGGNYLDALPDSVNGAAAAATFSTANHTLDFGNAEFVSVGNLAASEVYGSSPVSLATFSARTSGSVTLTAAKSWQRNSINQRFYLVDKPQAFCVQSGELRFYQNLDVTASSVPGLAGACAGNDCNIMARNIVGTPDFNLAAGTEDRNTKLTISLSFTEGGETIEFSQEVLVRNVP